MRQNVLVRTSVRWVTSLAVILSFGTGCSARWSARYDELHWTGSAEGNSEECTRSVNVTVERPEVIDWPGRDAGARFVAEIRAGGLSKRERIALFRELVEASTIPPDPHFEADMIASLRQRAPEFCWHLGDTGLPGAEALAVAVTIDRISVAHATAGRYPKAAYRNPSALAVGSFGVVPLLALAYQAVLIAMVVPPSNWLLYAQSFLRPQHRVEMVGTVQVDSNSPSRMSFRSRSGVPMLPFYNAYQREPADRIWAQVAIGKLATVVIREVRRAE